MRIFAIGVLLITLLGCNQDKIAQLEKQNQELAEINATLQEEAQVKEDYLKEYTETVNSVYENLELIRKREGFLSKQARSVEDQDRVSLREQMLSNIASIDEALKKSKSQLAQLRSRSSNYQQEAESLNKTLENLTRTIEEKEAQLEQYRAEVDQLTQRVAVVETELADRETRLEDKDREINKAWFVIGTKDELKEKGIITEEGGFLGIGKRKMLASDFRRTDFQMTDIRSTDVISIDGKADDVQLISPHSSDSFHLMATDEERARLEIIDPDAFWKVRYLVIMTKG